MASERIRRLITIAEDVLEASGRRLERPKRIVVAAAVVANPYVGEFVEDLSSWVDEMSESVGRTLADRLVEVLAGTAEAHGKGVMVGEDGDLEVGAALIHTLKFGNRLREATGASALMPATEKVGRSGASFDIPLRHVSDGTMRSHRETYTVQLPNVPRPDEIAVFVAATNAGRPHARIGVYTGNEATS